MWKDEYIAKFGIEKYKERLLKSAKYKAAHKEQMSEYNKIYRTEHLEQINEKHKIWYDTNKKLFQESNKIRCKNWYNTPQGRAKILTRCYRIKDAKNNKGICTLTSEQLINLWENGCYWCGETDWHKLGADRINNEQPHTLENCVCSCWNCNNERNNKSFDDFKKIKNII